MKFSRHIVLFAVIALCLGATLSLTAQGGGNPAGDPRLDPIGRDPGCVVAQLVSTGGPAPKDPQVLAIRWVGYSTFELAYNGQIFLLDAYYDRGPEHHYLGFKAADLNKANAILIGHGHGDHMSDAATVGARTGAIVIGGPPTAEKLLTQKIDPKQVRNVTGKGDEVFQFKGVKIEPVLGRHGEPPGAITKGFSQAIAEVDKVRPVPLRTDALPEIEGSNDPRVRDEGTIAYVLTFDNGFKLIYRDSAGVITDYERAAMKRIGGRTDVAIVATFAAYRHHETSQRAVDFMRAYNPDVFIPAHHDGPMNGLWRATDPMFRALKDANPSIITLSKGYREPTCFNTADNIQSRGK